MVFQSTELYGSVFDAVIGNCPTPTVQVHVTHHYGDQRQLTALNVKVVNLPANNTFGVRLLNDADQNVSVGRVRTVAVSAGLSVSLDIGTTVAIAAMVEFITN